MNIDELDKKYIYLRDGGKCFFCCRPLEENQITLDHYLPKSCKGTTDVFNLVTCCKRCNKQKGSRIPADYTERILELFLRAVRDNRIKGCNLKMTQKDLREQLLAVNKLEAVHEHFVFQSPEKRYYLKNNRVFKIIFVHTSVQEEDR